VIVLFEHRSFVHVIVGRHAVVVSVLRQQAYVFQVVPANIDIEEDDASTMLYPQ
jgi:hypothetical protein